MKLVFVLPHKEPAGHFNHTENFIKELSKKITVKKIYADNLSKLSYELKKSRLQGYETAYVHYSYQGVYYAKKYGYKTHYWNCGTPKEYDKYKPIIKFALAWTLKNCDYLVTGTQFMKNYYLTEYGVPARKIITLNNDIDTKVWKSKRKRTPPPYEVLYVHKLSKRKGAHYLKDIIREANLITPTNFTIIGDGDYKETLKHELKNMTLRGEVRLLGKIPNRKLPNYYHKANCLIVPSDEDGMPRVVLEAIATGTPYVAFDVGGIKEMSSPKQKFLVTPKGDVKQLAYNIFSAITWTQMLREEGKDWVKQYGTKKCIKEFLRKIK